MVDRAHTGVAESPGRDAHEPAGEQHFELAPATSPVQAKLSDVTERILHSLEGKKSAEMTAIEKAVSKICLNVATKTDLALAREIVEAYGDVELYRMTTLERTVFLICSDVINTARAALTGTRTPHAA